MQIQQKLSTWTKGSPLTEKVAQNADLHLTYTNRNRVQLDFLFFEKDDRLRLRFLGGDVNWLQISNAQGDLDAILNKLLETQDSFDGNAWFSFYLAFSGICDAAILAWEQYEPGYR